jgi:transposase
MGKDSEGASLRVNLRPRAHTRPVCSGCKRARPGYDTLPARNFEFVPLWGIAVCPANCKRCGVKVEAVPWATGKHTLTTTYMQFLALWARRLSWSEVAKIFHTSWEKVFHSVEWMVHWGLQHRRLTRIRSLGIDEVAWRKGHEYLTLVYQIDGHGQRLLWGCGKIAP